MSCLALMMSCAVGAGPVDPPSRPGSIAPFLAVSDDAIHLSWLERGTERHSWRVRFATLTGTGWNEPRTITARDDMFANWADVPTLIEVGETMLAHWPQKSGPATYAYDVALARSTDGGNAWIELGPVHDDGTKTEHGFVSMVPEGDAVRVFWLDGREMAAGEHGDRDGHGHGHGHGHGAMTLRTALVGGDAAAQHVLDDRICECCNTAAVATAAGPLIAYRDRDADEVRDISVVRRVGETWTKPTTPHADGWKIAACPVNGPALAARDALVAMAWYTGATETGSVLVSFSSDSGAHFETPLTLDDTLPMGRVGVVLEETGDAIVSWLDTSDGGAPGEGAIMVRRVSREGKLGAPFEVTTTSLRRSSGFPRIAIAGDDLLVVWTDAGPPTRIRAARVPLRMVPG